MKKSAISLGVAIALSAMAGCGGGGGGAAPTPTPTPTPAATTVSGVASKGIIQQGIVTAVELDSSGAELGVVGTGTTDASGQYSITLNSDYQGGLIKLVLTADANTRMRCDSFASCGSDAFGDDVTLPAGFTLNAVVAPAGSSVTGQITPLSHMVAARVLAQPTVSASALNNAVSELNQLVGVNVQTTPIVDITDPADLAGATEAARHLALFNAGLADLILNSGDANTALQNLADSFSDGEFSNSDPILISNIVAAVSGAAQQAASNPSVGGALADAIVDVQQGIEVVNSQVVNGEYNPEPSSNANAGEVAQAKALITSARSFLKTIVDDYADPMDALELDASTVKAVMSSESEASLRLAGEVLDQTISYLDSTAQVDLLAELQNPSSYEVPVQNGSGQSVGTMAVTFLSTTAGFAMNISGTLTSDPAVVINLTLGTNIAQGDLEINAGVIDALTADTVELALIGSISDGTTTATFNQVKLDLDMVASTRVDLNSESVIDDAADNVRQFTLVGDMGLSANGSSFNGAVELQLVPLNPGVSTSNDISLSGFSVDGEFTSAAGNRFDADVSLVVNNARQFDVFAYIESLDVMRVDWQYYPLTEEYNQLLDSVEQQYNLDHMGSTYQAVGLYYRDGGGENEGGVESADGYLSIDFTNSNYDWQTEYPQPGSSLDVRGDIYNIIYPIVAAELDLGDDLDFIHLDTLYVTRGDYGSYVALGYSAGTKSGETPENFFDATLIFSSLVDSPSLPPATVTASIERSSLEGAEASLTISHDGQSYTIEASVEGYDEDMEGTFTLSNADGVVVDLTLTDASNDLFTGTASVNGRQVGTIETTSDGLTLIRYNDGTFESLF